MPPTEFGEADLYRLLAEAVTDYAVFVVAEDRRVLAWGKGAERLLGYRSEEILGQSGDVIFTPEDLEQGVPAAEIKTAATTGCAEDERWHVRKDGSRFWGSGVVTPIPGDNGQIRGFAKVMRDQTDRRLREEALEEQARLAAFGRDVGMALTAAESLRETLDRCAAAMVHHLDAALARIWILNEAENVLELQASAGMYTHTDGPHGRIPVGKFKIGMIAQERKPHLTNTVVGDPRVHDQEWARREGIVAFAGYPLVIEGRLVGVMAMFARHPLSEAALAAMASVADEVALGVERKRVQAELDRQREWLRVTLSSIGDAVIATDTAGRVTFMNPVAEELTGWPIRDAAGRPLSEVFRIVNEYTRQPVENPVDKVLRDGHVVGLANHTVLMARDDTEHPIDDSAAPIRDSAGAVAGVVLVFHDVTEKRRQEEQNQELLAVIDTSTDLIGVAGLDGTIRYFNEAGLRLLGLRDLADARTRTLFDFVVPEDLPRVKEEMIPAVVRNGQWEGEWRYRNLRTGEHVPVSKKVSLIRNPLNGEPVAFSTVSRDVTEKKRQEEAVRATADRLGLALAAARLGDWSWDATTDLVTFSERAATIFGIPPGPHMTWARMQTLLHPDDRDRARQAVERAVSEGVQYDIEYRLHRPDGQRIWVSVLGRAQYDTAGRAVGMYGVVQDVTARKATEEALREEKRTVETLHAIGTRLSAELDLNKLLQAVTDETVALTGAAFGAFFYNSTDDKGDAYLLYTLSGAPREAFEKFPHPRATPIFEPTFKGQATVRLNDVTRDPRYGRNPPYNGMPAGHLPVRSYLAVSVKSRSGEVLGGLFFGHPQAGVFTARHERLVEGVAAQAAVAIDNARLYEQARRERSRAEVSEQVSRFLADASATLAALVDYESTLQKVARLAVPRFADWVAVDIVQDNGTLRRLAVAHANPAKVELAHALDRRYPPDPNAPHGAYHVLRTGRPEMMADIPDELLIAAARDPEHLRILRELGLKSFLCVPLAVRGRTFGVLTFVSAESGRRYDADDLAVAEDLAHRAAVAIENAQLYREVKEEARRKDEFLAMLAHELRNPLAPVRNGLQILRMRGVDAAAIDRTREMMDRQITHLVRMVDDLMDVSRVMRGKVELRKEPVDLATVVARAVETAQPALDAAEHQLEVSLPDRPLQVHGDVVRLTQVLSNLLVNAAKYSDRAGYIWVTAERRGGDAVIRVKDTGVGIARQDLNRIFELFAQVDRSAARSQGGLGIGLTLVRRLVELHGGIVTAHSDGPGTGSEFVIRLPALPDTAEGAEHGNGSAGAQTVGRRILLVDDNVDSAESLALLLRLAGHEVRTAYDGPAGLEAAGTYRPDVVLLDIGLPGMDGYQVARRLRNQPEISRALVVAMTGYGSEDDRRRSREAGFDHHLVKPVDPDELQGLLAMTNRPQ